MAWESARTVQAETFLIGRASVPDPGWQLQLQLWNRRMPFFDTFLRLAINAKDRHSLPVLR